ncbi:hypothetical protein ABH920_001044 [Catenulispora sp. EB89]
MPTSTTDRAASVAASSRRAAPVPGSTGTMPSRRASRRAETRTSSSATYPSAYARLACR